ncbi:EamA family transporter [Anoxybacillus rupiensis]|uniref:EamA family transporter n=1 Tax=Anoxybacteroides rupiense TaxID=311460 RepID=A0ABD5IR58_9BACL|nr:MULTISPECIES: EamA family transporter [Anoxybacillus]MBS2772147.1 EamA family transporter [Anoxybacillus rupiensis]MDE8563464.1 EamA family transporter [Anoxybacillus rupiensis]MED5050744.1 EamA family transporter [Anoxybacillus rupiensis]OQM47361.1 multidrug transporter [Anoxybacillus sp. UARK-01]QHC05698.1 EamA family transporter [Anoxybacillus sp. PDR2]
MISSFLLLLIMTLSGALGGYYFKKASSQRLGFQAAFLLPLFIGGMLYGIGAVLNIIILKQLPYTIVFPLTSITYIWTLGLSYVLLKEHITRKKMAGVLLILIGSIFLVL